jgi:hypothetical protein
MLTEADRRGWNAIDEVVERSGGSYVAYYPGKKTTLEYDYRAMTKYCSEKGVSKMDLTEAELKLFEFDPPLAYPREKENPRADA